MQEKLFVFFAAENEIHVLGEGVCAGIFFGVFMENGLVEFVADFFAFEPCAGDPCIRAS
jgi:hypothetical protein